MKHKTVVAIGVCSILASAVVSLGEEQQKGVDVKAVMAKAAARQKAAAKKLGKPVEITNSIGMKLRLIPAGEFIMGSPESDDDAEDHEKPQHRVRITQPFYMGATEVTQGQWKTVIGSRPWNDKHHVNEGPFYPATCVSWHDAGKFCRELSKREDASYRLPTEAEWEYACRGGTNTVYHFGDHSWRLGNYCWFYDNTHDLGNDYGHRVGHKNPNAFGLYDTHGNVWEWCSDRYDRYHQDYYDNSPVDDPPGPRHGSMHVCRGGGCPAMAQYCRSADRGANLPDSRLVYLGFRVARDVTDTAGN